tara:strand:- start:7888 stop:8883 length:996 start_codon:yes stop_codon:yes gene_type:complete
VAEFIIGNPLRKWARKYPLLQQMLWWLDYALLWLLQSLLRLLPVDLSSRLGERIGTFIGPFMRSKNAILRDNMAVAFPGLQDAEVDALVQRVWGRAGRILAEYPHLGTIGQEPGRLQIEIRQAIPTYADPTRPAVVISAHLSNWEICALALARMGIPNASLYSPPSNPWLDRLLLRSRRALGCELLPRDNSARALLRALRHGRTIGMIIDRRVDEGRPIPFFGRDKSSTLMPAKLALKHNCDFVPIQVIRLQDARYQVIFHPPIRPADSSADEQTQAMDMTRQAHQLFERWIEGNPQDWFCSKRLWPKAKKAKLPVTEEAPRGAHINSRAA